MTIVMLGQKGLPARSGGLERHVELLSTGLVSRGYRVIVFGRAWYVGNTPLSLPRRGAGGEVKGIEQVFTRGIHTKHLDAITHSLSALFAARAYDPDVIHMHGVGVALLLPLARLLFPHAMCVVTAHSMDRRLQKWGLFAKLAFLLGEWMSAMFAHEIVGISQEIVQYWRRAYGRRAVYAPHAFTTAFAETRSTQEARVRTLGLVPKKYLLCTGRLLENKGQDRFLEAFAWAKAFAPEALRGIDGVIVGGSSFTDGYSAHVRNLVEATPDAVYVGERFGAELHALQSCTLGHVFATTDEGLSLAVLEAAMTKRPILTHDFPANIEATGGYVLKTDVRSPELFGRALLELAHLSAREGAVLGEGAAAHVREAYHLVKNLDVMDHLYRGVLTEDDRLVSSLSGL